MFPATAVPTTPVPMCAPNSRPSSASLGRSSAGWYRFFFPNWGWWTVACALKISCFTKGKFCNVNERVDQSTWLRSRQTVELPLACKLPRNRHVGDAEPVYQRHCRRLRHYVSAPSPGIDQSERATCILCIAIVPLNDFLSGVVW